jgi:hypothetical protein
MVAVVIVGDRTDQPVVERDVFAADHHPLLDAAYAAIADLGDTLRHDPACGHAKGGVRVRLMIGSVTGERRSS